MSKPDDTPPISRDEAIERLSQSEWERWKDRHDPLAGCRASVWLLLAAGTGVALALLVVALRVLLRGAL